jgi:ABC-type phosphate transport system substrate-binding protein
MKKLKSQIGIFCFILFYASFTTAEISVIVHPDNAMTSIREKETKKIFLGKSKKFSGGGKAVPIDQAGGSAARDAFHSKITKKNAAKLKSYWSRMVFTGKAQSPKEVADDAAMIGKVSGNPKAIGYVDSGSVNDSVKVILTIP